MCGFAGIWCPPGTSGEAEMRARLLPMSEAIRHRGPDDAGEWCEPDSGFAVAHRRLAIIDPSPCGAQPMHSACGRWVLGYNGEIYNHLELRAELGSAGVAPEWRGHSDTETLLAGIAHWGLEEALRRSHGMFAFALWDRQERNLHLARDRFGEKPLYYGRAGDTLLFGSELTALMKHPEAVAAPDEDAVALFLALSYIPAPRTIWRGFAKLEPGQIATFRGHDAAPDIRQWFDFDTLIVGARARDPITMDDLDKLLGEVVEQHMISDVPLGAFLSGGIDSSLVTALMQERSTAKIRSFAVGFDDPRFDETGHAAAVAKHLGTDHTEIRLTGRDALDLVPQLATIYDEPFADVSAIPTALLCREAGRDVTVALTGDGADEVFGGYNRHLRAPAIWRKLRQIPSAIRAPVLRGAGKLRGLLGPDDLGEFSAQKWDQFVAAFGRAQDFPELYRRLVTTGPELGLHDHIAAEATPAALSPAERLMRWDMLGYLPGDILTKVDRASMAASLETRAPFLDLRVVEAAWSLSIGRKIADGTGKLPLRDFLARRLPRELFERPKQGFAIPLADWLRGPLRDWGQYSLETIGRLEATSDYAKTLTDCWEAHLAGRGNHATTLGNAFILAEWLSHGTAQA